MKKSISTERRLLLNQGIVQTADLMETLAIDFNHLLATVVPHVTAITLEHSLGITKRMKRVAEHLIQQCTTQELRALRTHNSDTVRGWACYIISLTAENLKEALETIHSLADDTHFGVREWAWLAIRPHIVHDPLTALSVLTTWTHHTSANIRRFASEATRPRGVWCSHISLLKKEPWHALPLLENLRTDQSIYVQKSVGNWLSDAAKAHLEWVEDVCRRWISEIPENKAVQKITQRAHRNIISKKYV